MSVDLRRKRVLVLILLYQAGITSYLATLSQICTYSSLDITEIPGILKTIKLISRERDG